MNENDIVNLLKDKSGLLKYILDMIASSEKFTQGLRSMKDRGFSQEGMLEKVIEVSSIQSQQIKHLALVALLIVQSNDFDTTVALLMNKMGRGQEALRVMMANKFGGKFKDDKK